MTSHQTPPNLIVLVWHDTGRTFNTYGHATAHTPHTDRLAQQGAQFENCFATCAICSPSRASIFTGRTCQDHGVMHLANGPEDNRIRPGATHLAQHLRDLGYHTALVGVQHEACPDHVPSIQNFHETRVAGPWPAAPRVADAACDFLNGRASDTTTPFYLQLGFFEAHRPFDFEDCPPDTSLGVDLPPYLRDTESHRHDMAGIQGMLRRGDAAFGRILDQLDQLGLEEHTVVVVTADHGLAMPRAKTQMYDAGIEIPWIVRYPSVVPACQRITPMCSQLDIAPTLMELMGLPPLNADAGHSFAPHLHGEDDRPRRDAHFAHMVEAFRCIRTNTHKLIRNFNPPNAWGALPIGNPLPHGVSPEQMLQDRERFPFVELYDLTDDPLESRNLAADPDHAELRDRLDARLLRFLHDQHDFVLATRPNNTFSTAAVQHANDNLRRLMEPAEL
ncbi:MAG: sulfatase [Planctomycetota bacterium]